VVRRASAAATSKGIAGLQPVNLREIGRDLDVY
jgi:hypothetical protein